MRVWRSVYGSRHREKLKETSRCQRCRCRIDERGTVTLCGQCRKNLALQARIRYHVRRAIERLEKEASA